MQYRNLLKSQKKNRQFIIISLCFCSTFKYGFINYIIYPRRTVLLRNRSFAPTVLFFPIDWSREKKTMEKFSSIISTYVEFEYRRRRSIMRKKGIRNDI